MSKFSLKWAAIVLAVAACGCGKPGEDQLPVFSVKGTVAYNGQPMKGASIVLVPNQHDRKLRMPPFGVVGEDGTLPSRATPRATAPRRASTK